MSEPAGVYCYRHPNRETLIRCTRCDRPICPDCMRPASVGFHCPDDVDRGVRSTRAPRTAVGAKLLSAPPYVTIVLIVLNVAAYLWTGLHSVGGLDAPYHSSLFQKWQLLPEYVHDKDQYYRLLTSGFLHISLLHIASNMLALGIIGPPIEALLGRWRFATLYLLGLLGGSVAVYTFDNRIGATAGASGAIFALFGAALVLVRKLSLDPQYLVGVIVLNFVLTFSIHDISKLGHIGGFVTGALAAVAIGGLPRVRQRIGTQVQVGGLVGVVVLIGFVAILRTATW